jgi:uncharacterized membrane protein
MNRPVKLILALLISAAVGHVATVFATPTVLMSVAMKRLSAGTPVNHFAFGDRTTEKSRRVVRPSPDLAYSSCVYDLSDGPIHVTAAPSPDGGYLSISVFAANTDNIGVYDSLRSPAGIDFVLAKSGQPTPPGASVLISPSTKGIILDRRLAPNAELFAVVDKARRADTCAPVSPPR